MNNRLSNTAGYLLAAFSLGLLCGILIAPRKGEESREILKDKLEEGYRQTGKFIVKRLVEIRAGLNDYSKEFEDLKVDLIKGKKK